jgi:hypothetical protein
LTWTIQKQLGRLIKKVLGENEKKEEDESNKNTSHPNSLSSLDLREVKNLGDPRDRLKTQLQLIDYLIFLIKITLF